jgi:uncharacterized protein YegP (UPF0339 family)
MTHFFQIKNTAGGQYMSRFMYNAEPIVWSEQLTTKASAKANAESVKKNACLATIVDQTKGETGSGYRFEIFDTADDQFMVRFKAPNGETVVVSERYTAKHNAINAAKSVRDNSAEAEIRDNTTSAAA